MIKNSPQFLLCNLFKKYIRLLRLNADFRNELGKINLNIRKNRIK